MESELKVWEAVAPAWDHFRNEVFEPARAVSQWIVDRAGLRPGLTALELAAGPGETGFLAAERLGPDGRLISSDFSPAMVEAARRAAQARGIGNAEFRVIDAQAIDLAHGSVDAVISRFGLMLIPDPQKAFAEIRRVLRSGGRLAYAVWGPPENNLWMVMLGAAMLTHGHLPPGDPMAPGGVFSLAQPDPNAELLREAGFSEPETEALDLVMEFGRFDDYWNLQSQVGGGLAVAIASLAPDQVDAVRETTLANLEPFRSGQQYRTPARALCVATS